jgi:hypothetical protein
VVDALERSRKVRRLDHITLDEFNLLGKGKGAGRREVVERYHLVLALDEPGAQGTTQESGPAGDEDPQRPTPE